MNGQFATGFVFLLYMIAVFVITLAVANIQKGKSFVEEYFLGGRGLGTWAFAFTVAATAASGGTFAGFPSLVYSHGWIMALWIASYMVVPIVTMGMLGKRLHQVARRAGAVTLPDVLGQRYASPALGTVATLTIVFFMVTNLIAQFKAGGIILEVILRDTPYFESHVLPTVEGLFRLTPFAAAANNPGYALSLIIFSITTILYTAYGGYRAVVWTDVLQGVVMGIGVMLLLPLTLWAAGGLPYVTKQLSERPPTAIIGRAADNNVLEYQAAKEAPRRLLVMHQEATGPRVSVISAPTEDGGTLFTVSIPKGATARDVEAAVRDDPAVSKIMTATLPKVGKAAPEQLGLGAAALTSSPVVLVAGAELVHGPGRRSDGSAFHPLAMAISFFFMWAISGAGQPGTLVRLMSFRDTATLRNSIVTVTIYYAIIYLPLVLIFVAARTLIHPAEMPAGSDYIMPTLAKTVAHPALAGLIIAAPFAAVMSTVDSFLLIISSCVVRDIYQRSINPNVPEQTVKNLCYIVTAVAGFLVMMLAFDPPEFLQDIIVFTGAGFASTYLGVVTLGIYWKGMTRAGAWASMVGGFLAIILLHAPLFLSRIGFAMKPSSIKILGFEPLLIGLFVSFGLGIVVSLVTPKLPATLIHRYFGKWESASPS